VSLRALEEYRRKSLSEGNIFFYLTGNVTDEDIEYLSGIVDTVELEVGEPNPTTAPIPEGFMARPREIFVKNSDYTAVRFTFDLDMSKMTVAETDLLYDLLLSGYSSRLFIEMSEERGLVYDISGNLERYRNIGTLSFFYEVKGQDAERAIALTVDVLNSMKNPSGAEPITAGYTDNAYLLYDDMRDLNFTFAYDNKIMSASYASVEERRASYKAVTAERLASLASLIFRRDNLTLTMKADKRKTDKAVIESIAQRLG
jgi:predicted Zn-dependent peptidase